MIDKFLMDAYALTRPATFFHEMFHMTRLVTFGKTWDYAYDAEDVYDLARYKNTDSAVYNADSWVITALAIWAQRRWNLPAPPVPARYSAHNTSNGLTSLYNFSRPMVDVVYVDAKNVVPQGASPVVNGTPFFVDTNLWDIYTPTDTPPSPTDTCTGSPSTGGCVTATKFTSVAP